MVYAIERKGKKIAGQALPRAEESSWEKGKENASAKSARVGANADADHLCELCHRDRAGHPSAQPACCQQAWAAGCTGCHVHRHKRYLRYWSGAGYLDPVHLLRAGR